MAEFTFFEVNRDPLNASWVQVGRQGTAVIKDDLSVDNFLQPFTEDSGAQFSIDGVDFTTSAYPTYAATGSNVEIYQAQIYGCGRNTVTFAYLTAAGDGVDDRVNRIMVLEGGPIGNAQWLQDPQMIDGNSNIPWTAIPSIICFTPSTMIATPRGSIAVEALSPGDLVITADNGLQAIRWVGRKPITRTQLRTAPHLRPIRIRKNAFGNDLPDRDMLVSPQHRMLVQSYRTELEYGEKQILAPAKGLVNDLSITVDYAIKETEYIHILFDKHEIIYANGTPTESFHPGSHAMDTLEQNTRNELLEIFPELIADPESYGSSARMCLTVSEAKTLADRGRHQDLRLAS